MLLSKIEEDNRKAQNVVLIADFVWVYSFIIYCLLKGGFW
jgi:hypothetical protein